MNTFSIKKLLGIVAACGIACWFFLVPVPVSVHARVHIGYRYPHSSGDKVYLFGTSGTEEKLIKVPFIIGPPARFVEYINDGRNAIVTISRWNYLSFEENDWLALHDLTNTEDDKSDKHF